MKLIVNLLMAMLLVSCAHVDVPTVQGGLPPLGEGAAGGGYRYEVIPGDILVVNVHNNLGLSGSFLVTQEGDILYSFIGKIGVAGLSTEEIRDLLAVLLEDYIYEPIINVSVKGQEIYVLGEVKRPGPIPYENNMTVRKALLSVGGANGRASVNNIIIKRIVNGKEIMIRVKMGDIVLPDDIVEVPLSFW